MNKYLLKYLSTIVAIPLLTSCGTHEEHSHSSSYPQSQTKWKSNTIPVCWETSGFQIEKSWVHDRVNQQFNRTPVRFTGWGDCRSNSKGIRVAVSDEGPHVKALGRLIDGRRQGMVLNFTFNNWSSSCKSKRQDCIEDIAVHEFGHAIGLAHEQNRPDTNTDLCTDAPQGSDGDFLIGPWDSSSVMNYCNPIYSNDGILSSGDILGIRFLYEGLLPFSVQKGTGIHETSQNFEIRLGNFDGDNIPDMFAIKKSGTGSGKTEVHILSGKSNHRTFVLQAPTGLGSTGSNFTFELGDWDHDGRSDIFAIKKSATGTSKTEIHILSAASNYRNFILQTGTALHITNSNWEFAIDDYNRDGRPDVYAIKKDHTGTSKTEVHILNGKSNFKSFALQVGTVLHKTDRKFEMEVSDWNGDHVPDLIAIAKSSTGSDSTEVHVLDGKSNFSKFIFQRGTLLEETNDNYTFSVADIDRRVPGKEIVVFKKKATGTNSTEMHVLRTW